MARKFLIQMTFIALLFVLVTSKTYALVRIDLNGYLTKFFPAVLGDDDEKKEEAKEEQKQEAEKKEVEKVKEELKKNAEQAKKIKETNREIVKKIDEKAKEEKQKNIEQVKIQSKTDLKISVASESGEIEEIEDEEVELETEFGTVGFKNNPDDKSILITQGSVSVHTDLPLSIDPKTKKVSVESEGEVHEVKVLPEEALSNASLSGTLDKFEMVVENGQVVYLINDIKNEKLLGLFSISIPEEIKVSGKTGQVFEAKQTFLNKILDLLSI